MVSLGQLVTLRFPAERLRDVNSAVEQKITALLRSAGWAVNAKRVQCIWRREGLRVPQKQPKRGRLWLDDGSCVRLRASWPNHVWSYDSVEGRTHEGKKFRMGHKLSEGVRRRITCCVRR